MSIPLQRMRIVLQDLYCYTETYVACVDPVSGVRYPARWVLLAQDADSLEEAYTLIGKVYREIREKELKLSKLKKRKYDLILTGTDCKNFDGAFNLNRLLMDTEHIYEYTLDEYINQDKVKEILRGMKFEEEKNMFLLTDYDERMTAISGNCKYEATAKLLLSDREVRTLYTEGDAFNVLMISGLDRQRTSDKFYEGDDEERLKLLMDACFYEGIQLEKIEFL